MTKLTIDVNLRGFRSLGFLKPRDERVRKEGKKSLDEWSEAARKAAAEARKAKSHGGQRPTVNHAQQVKRAALAQGYEHADYEDTEHTHVYEHPKHEGHSIEYHHSGPNKGEWNHSFRNDGGEDGTSISTVNEGKGHESLKKWLGSKEHKSDVHNLQQG